MQRTTRRPSVRTVLAAATLTVALSATLTGCTLGFDAATGEQGPSGNGASANLPLTGPSALQLRGITLVMGPEGSNTATLIGSMFNLTTTDDALTGAQILEPASQGAIGGTAAVAGALPIKAQSGVRVGFNSEDHVDFAGVSVLPTRYVTLRVTFEKSGQVEMPVMVVPAEGVYADIAPLGG